MNNPEVMRVLRLQLKLTLAAVALSAILGGGRLNIMVSTLLGGLSALIPAWVYSRIAYAKRHVPPSVLMRAHFRGEAVKFMLTVAMFGCVLLYYRNFSVAGLFCGYFAAISGYWFGLLIK
ncbi:MAG: ATP synthase subunit I [Paludibacterium sp.]|uniref:ATP synthase subunit I n=1 Tax=Paludibacterium sp. TaxID=1917523 RepID=UPI0025F26AD1|nr:ATP synthase subunit I [Paludibacterium sp.]MBV8047793.1 ATP synthase subunit I [Paludibacterium sp.]MBV8647376.1 ATP synthase subunit I [Paludibacterium sp.]